MAYISMTLSHFRHGGRTARLATPRARSGSDGYYSWFLVSKTKFPDHPRFMFSAGVSLQCVIGGTPPRCHWARRDDGGFCSIRSPSHFAPCPLSLTTATRFEINVAEQIPICLFGHASNDHVLANGTGNITSFAFHSILLLGELDRLIFCLHLQQSASWVSAEMDVLLKPSFEIQNVQFTEILAISRISRTEFCQMTSISRKRCRKNPSIILNELMSPDEDLRMESSIAPHFKYPGSASLVQLQVNL
ncbi:hypothetical protein C8J56DRAFT_891225 [Mycena floridula]|nr:hypothetical protein C8J56DRAFT_891225 [Mycena floridula]